MKKAFKAVLLTFGKGMIVVLIMMLAIAYGAFIAETNDTTQLVAGTVMLAFVCGKIVPASVDALKLKASKN